MVVVGEVSELPCDGEGVCMACKTKPLSAELLTCKTCVTPWHATCLSPSSSLKTLADALEWDCPDCDSSRSNSNAAGAAGGIDSDLVAAMRAIESDHSLTEQEKAKRRQDLMLGSKTTAPANGGGGGVLNLLDQGLSCSFCMKLPEHPVTTGCGHNFCLKCFQKWVGQGKRTCTICRTPISQAMISKPRINYTIVAAIRVARMSKSDNVAAPPKVYHFVQNQNRPDKAFTTDRAKKTGNANACSGKIFVTVPRDHFGPILAEHDPERNQGTLVGEAWDDRMQCRQWGAHFPHVAGIAGQAERGAQSVALSGGYEDDEDHGEWFLYTGSGGRDLSGNKRTNKKQSFDQRFDKSNEALRVSCRKGYPVRVVRSFKEKRSIYAPVDGVRYDGIYRIEMCWRKPGIQGFKVCRYLFVRCDNAPAPWTSDEHGDRPRPLPIIQELENATDITQRKGDAFWDYDVEKGCWMWKKPPPPSQLQENGKKTNGRRKKRGLTIEERLLKEFSCLICRKVMSQPLTTPCAHNFCKACLEGVFAGQTFTRQTKCEGRRTLRTRKNIMKCPSCSNDISDFLQNPQVNRELMGVIESLQQQNKESKDKELSEELDATDEKSDLVCDNGDLEDEDGDGDCDDDNEDGDLEVEDGDCDDEKLDEDGSEGNQKSLKTKSRVINKRKRASANFEKASMEVDDVKAKAAKLKTAGKGKSKLAAVGGEGKRMSKRKKAN